MNDWFSVISKISALSAKAVQDLNEIGFTVISGAIKSDDLLQLAAAYDSAVSLASLEASPDEMRIGSTSTRVNDFVNRGSEFDSLYIFQPLLEASYQVIGQPFKLSSMHARTFHPNSQAHTTNAPRHLIQGAFIPRAAQAAADFQFRTSPETLARIGSLAKYLLAV